MAKGHGGKRAGAGKPKGTLWPSTILKAKAREHLARRVIAELDPLLDAQIRNAKGIDHFFMRDQKTKQFVQITDPKMIEAALNAGDEDNYYWINSKDPSTQAFTALLDRAIDKPTEHVENEISGNLTLGWQA